MAIMSASELYKLTSELQYAKLQAEMAREAEEVRAAASLKQAFQSRELAPDVADRINVVIRAAAERGEREVLVLRFPSSFCTDGGRRINNGEEDWPDSLEGFARTAFDFFVKELRPLDFTMRAQIMDFPDGLPGDVGLYLHW